MTPDRTQSNPRLSDALAEQTIAEADGEAASLRAELATLRTAAADLAVLTDEAIDEHQGLFAIGIEPSANTRYANDLRARIGEALRAVRIAIAPPPRPVPPVVPGSALARFVEGYRRCTADVVAYLRSDANEGDPAFEIETGHHIGAAARGKEGERG